MNSYSKLMLAASLSITSGVTLAAEVVPLHNNNAAIEGFNAVATKKAFAQTGIQKGKANSFQLTNSIAKHFSSQTTGSLQLISHKKQDNRQFVRYQQTFRGLEIHNHQVVMTVDNQGLIEKGYGALVRGIEKDIPALPKMNDSAGKVALEKFIETYYNDVERVFRDKTAEAVIYIDDNQTARLAYRIKFFTDVKQGQSHPQKVMAFVDVFNGEVISKEDILRRYDIVPAGGPGGNEKEPRLSPYSPDDGDMNPRQTFTVKRKWAGIGKYDCIFNADNVKTRDYKHGTTNSDGNFTFECNDSNQPYINNERKVNYAESPLNDAHYNAQLTSEMFLAYVGQKPFGNSVITQNVHYGTGLDQAFYDNGQVSYGDGQWLFYPMTTLDVVAHEIAHGFTEEYGTGNSNKKYMVSGEAAAINEAFSDMAGAAAEYYLYNGTLDNGQPWTDDWMSNQGSFQYDGALRYFANPTIDGVSIDHMRDLEATTPPHYAAGIFNKAFYLLVTSAVDANEASPWNTKYAFKLFANANHTCWAGNSGFIEAASCVLDNVDTVTAQLVQDGVGKSNGTFWTTVELQNHVRKAFSKVGINLAINQGLESDFSFSGRFLDFTFTDKSRVHGSLVQDDQGAQWSWLWDFGDNTTSTLPNPTHTYAQAGDYVVTLTTTNETDGVSDSLSLDVNVTSGYCSAAGSNYDKYYVESVRLKDDRVNSGSAGYTDHTGTPVSVVEGVAFDVEIAAGQPASSVNNNKNFYLWVDENNDGIFHKTDELKLSGLAKDKVNGSVSLSKPKDNKDENVNLRARAIVSFGIVEDPCETISFGEVEDFTLKLEDNTVDPNLVISLQRGTNEVSFVNNTNDGRITSWLWNFGDGQTSNQKSPTHQYRQSGSYSVSLTAKNSSNQVIATWNGNVANFTTTTTPEIREVVDGLNVIFDGSFSERPVGSTFNWVFEDVGSSNEVGPISVDFPAAGIYDVNLTITNPDNQQGVKVTKQVEVFGPSYTPEFTASNSDLVGNFTNNSGVPSDLSGNNSVATLIWDFGDGSTPQEVQVADFGADNSYTYSQAGTYTVSLTIKYYDTSEELVTVGPVTQSVTVTDPAAAPEYCNAVGDTGYEHIASTNFNNHGVLTNANTGALTVVNEGNPITMTAGQNISYTITGGFDDFGPYSENYHVWIDMNGDGLFGDGDWRNDSSERVVTSFDQNASGGVSGSFVIPAHKVADGVTNTRMRVIQYWSDFSTNTVDPCSDYVQNGESGEIEDYEVTIIKN